MFSLFDSSVFYDILPDEGDELQFFEARSFVSETIPGTKGLLMARLTRPLLTCKGRFFVLWQVLTYIRRRGFLCIPIFPAFSDALEDPIAVDIETSQNLSELFSAVATEDSGVYNFPVGFLFQIFGVSPKKSRIRRCRAFSFVSVYAFLVVKRRSRRRRSKQYFNRINSRSGVLRHLKGFRTARGIRCFQQASLLRKKAFYTTCVLPASCRRLRKRRRLRDPIKYLVSTNNNSQNFLAAKTLFFSRKFPKKPKRRHKNKKRSRLRRFKLRRFGFSKKFRRRLRRFPKIFPRRVRRKYRFVRKFRALFTVRALHTNLFFTVRQGNVFYSASTGMFDDLKRGTKRKRTLLAGWFLADRLFARVEHLLRLKTVFIVELYGRTSGRRGIWFSWRTKSWRLLRIRSRTPLAFNGTRACRRRRL